MLGENHRKTHWKMEVYPLVICYIANWNITMEWMGKSAISTGPFSIVMLVYERVMVPKKCIFSNDHQEKTFENRSYLGGLEHGFYFPYYMGCHPSHWLIYFRGVRIPPTRYPRFWLFKYLASPWIWIKLSRRPRPMSLEMMAKFAELLRVLNFFTLW